MVGKFYDAEERASSELFYDPQEWNALRENLQHEANVAELTEITGIRDRELLAALAGLDVGLESLSTLTLLPTMLVAWASGRVEPGELARIAELSAEGREDPSRLKERLLAAWTEREPTPAMFRAWKECITEISEQIPPHLAERLVEHVVEQAESIATASGGFLGWAAVSGEELEALERIRSVVDAASGKSESKTP